MADTADADVCGASEYEDSDISLRIGAIFIILVTSLAGTLFPILARRSRWKCPTAVFDFAKYVGSGVIIATAFIHLLAPAFESLGSECLSGAWGDYPWAAAIPMVAIFFLFFVEFFSYRWGKAKLEAAGYGGTYDNHGHDIEGAGGNHGPEPTMAVRPGVDEGKLGHKHEHGSDVESVDDAWTQGDAVAQILGVCILEFGVIFHSIFIGLTLATTSGHSDFVILFIVIIFHQSFEGLGLGSRLAFLPLPRTLNWVPVVGAVVYSFVTPIGMAIGLGVRQSYSDSATGVLIASGVLDAVSAGILLWTGLVELLAHEFLFNPAMQTASNGKCLYAFSCVCLGAGLMALLGRWA